MNLVPRKCLVQDPETDKNNCGQYGTEGCDWNFDALVDCIYIRGDPDIDLSRWEVQ